MGEKGGAKLVIDPNDPTNFTLGILGDLHMDPRDTDHSYEAGMSGGGGGSVHIILSGDFTTRTARPETVHYTSSLFFSSQRCVRRDPPKKQTLLQTKHVGMKRNSHDKSCERRAFRAGPRAHEEGAG
jgi:hypothetical protein